MSNIKSIIESTTSVDSIVSSILNEQDTESTNVFTTQDYSNALNQASDKFEHVLSSLTNERIIVTAAYVSWGSDGMAQARVHTDNISVTGIMSLVCKTTSLRLQSKIMKKTEFESSTPLRSLKLSLWYSSRFSAMKQSPNSNKLDISFTVKFAVQSGKLVVTSITQN